jgi:membrane-associated phospholipid phosphatase
MSLNHRQLHRLHRIESGLRRSDPQLAAMLAMFGRLSAGQHLPAWEQVATRQDRIRQAAALIVKAITILTVALSLLLNAVRALVTAIVIGTRARPAPSARRPADPGTGAGDPQDWNPAQGS